MDPRIAWRVSLETMLKPTKREGGEKKKLQYKNQKISV